MNWWERFLNPGLSVESLIRQLKDEHNSRKRVRAAQHLGQLQCGEAVAALVEQAIINSVDQRLTPKGWRQNDLELGRAALRALAAIGHPSAAQLLVDAVVSRKLQGNFDVLAQTLERIADDTVFQVLANKMVSWNLEYSDYHPNMEGGAMTERELQDDVSANCAEILVRSGERGTTILTAALRESKARTPSSKVPFSLRVSHCLKRHGFSV